MGRHESRIEGEWVFHEAHGLDRFPIKIASIATEYSRNVFPDQTATFGQSGGMASVGGLQVDFEKDPLWFAANELSLNLGDGRGQAAAA
jgi:hypothetical protein